MKCSWVQVANSVTAGELCKITQPGKFYIPVFKCHTAVSLVIIIFPSSYSFGYLVYTFLLAPFISLIGFRCTTRLHADRLTNHQAASHQLFFVFFFPKCSLHFTPLGKKFNPIFQPCVHHWCCGSRFHHAVALGRKSSQGRQGRSRGATFTIDNPIAHWVTTSFAPTNTNK